MLGISRHKVKDYVYLLEYTYFIQPVSTFTTRPDKEFSKQQKIYFSDTGILQALAQVSSGQVFENAIALQLMRLGEVRYYQKLSGQEIDFILNNTRAIEVKETPVSQDLGVLKNRANSIGLTDVQLIGRYLPASHFSDFYWGGSIV